jgi:hypothetical protein
MVVIGIIEGVTIIVKNGSNHTTQIKAMRAVAVIRVVTGKILVISKEVA